MAILTMSRLTGALKFNWLRRTQAAAPPAAPVEESRPGRVGLIVGLGNPGGKYRDTRHNIGFMVVERLAARHGFIIGRKFRRALVGEWPSPSGRIVIVEPQTFMNASGESVTAIAQFYRLKPDQVLLVSDDSSLPFGKIRIRRSGSEGGHNGLRSVSQCLGTREYPRLRIGVGSPPAQMDLVDYVLGSFPRQELIELPDVLDRAADAIEAILTDGVEAAMNRFNGS